MMQRLLAVLLGVWLGAQLAVGYAVAPVLFARLPVVSAGQIAGILFGLLSYFGLIVWGIAAYVGYRTQERRLRQSRSLKLISVLLVMLAVNEWLLTPVINALKNDTAHWLLGLSGGSFAMWHGLSSLIYLLVTLLGGYLVLRWLRFDWS